MTHDHRAPDVDHTIEHVGIDKPYQLALTSAVIAGRYQDHPLARWLISDPARRGEIMHRTIETRCHHALRHGEIHLATHYLDVDDRPRRATVPQAAAIWLHYDHPDSPPAPPHGFREQLARDYGSYADRFALLADLLTEHHPVDRGPHHQLQALAALHRSLGQGTALLHHHLSVLDARGLGAYLVAADTRSRDLYAQFGFENLDRVLELPGDNRSGPCHVMYPMWRRPAAPATTTGPVASGPDANPTQPVLPVAAQHTGHLGSGRSVSSSIRPLLRRAVNILNLPAHSGAPRSAGSIRRKLPRSKTYRVLAVLHEIDPADHNAHSDTDRTGPGVPKLMRGYV